jgi:hypothetical protein
MAKLATIEYDDTGRARVVHSDLPERSSTAAKHHRIPRKRNESPRVRTNHSPRAISMISQIQFHLSTLNSSHHRWREQLYQIQRPFRRRIQQKSGKSSQNLVRLLPKKRRKRIQARLIPILNNLPIPRPHILPSKAQENVRPLSAI